MARLLLMVRKDLLRQVRSPLTILLVLAFPLIFAALLALVFGGGNRPSIQVELLVEDADDSFLSGMLLSVLSGEQLAEYADVRQVGTDGQAMMERGEASALLLIPAGFGDDLLAARPVTLELVRNPSEGILPEIAEQGLTIFADVLGAGSLVLRDPLEQMQPLLEGEADDPDAAARVAAVSVAFYDAIDRSSTYVLPPAITLESVDLGKPDEDTTADAGGTGTVFLFVLPGIAVWALFMVGDITMRDIITETKIGTLRRQLSGPVEPWQVVIGKGLFTASAAAISLVLLAAIGAVASSGRANLPGFLLLSAAVVAAVVGLNAMIYGVARTERQGSTVGSMLMLSFAFLGGSFFPIDSLPESARRLAPLSPFYWGTTGYHALLRDGSGVAGILTHALVLAAIGAVGFVVGALLLRKKARDGALA